jgi:Protein of unknown function (DUF1003)
MAFAYLHVLWFTIWIVINETRWRFDPYPFGLLTLIVSLEEVADKLGADVKQVHATAKARIAQSTALANADSNGSSRHHP